MWGNRKLALATFLAFFASSPVQPAEIRGTSSNLCAFSLEGPIISGDHDRLSSLIARSRLDDLDERTRSLCLKSNGGSYVEGLKIAELVYRIGLSTVVADGSKCFSACAVIFMAGVVAEKTGSASVRQIGPHRKLSAGGMLGFHAPFLSLPDEKYSKEQVESAAQGMRLAVLGLLQFSSKQTMIGGGDFIKKSLVEAVIGKGPQELLFVKSIGDAARWGIEVYDFAEQFPKPSNGDGIKNLCNNFHYSNMDQPVPTATNLSLKVEQFSSRFQPENYRIMVQNSRTSDTVCEIYPIPLRGSSEPTFLACSYDYWSSKSFGDCREYKAALLIGRAMYVPNFYTLGPSTPLKPFSK